METTIIKVNSALKVRDIRNCAVIAAATDAGMITKKAIMKQRHRGVIKDLLITCSVRWTIVL